MSFFSIWHSTKVLGFTNSPSILFLRSLPRRYQRLFVLAGAIYVGGAIGMEVLGGWYIAALGSENLGYEMLATAEETMEMFGVVLFIYSLLAYMGDPDESLEIRIEGTSA